MGGLTVDLGDAVVNGTNCAGDVADSSAEATGRASFVSANILPVVAICPSARSPHRCFVPPS